MKRHSQILAGTALGLLMTSAPLAALPLPQTADLRHAEAFGGRVILAQETTETEEERRLRLEREAAEEAAEEEPGQAPAGEPAAEEPAAEEPAADEPVEEPAPEEPAATDEPAAEEPVAEEPAADEPVEEPAADEPVEEPAPEEPATTDEPAAEEPVAEEPAADEPVEEPAADEPVAEEPATDEPAGTQEPAEEPAADEPAADEPVEEPAAEQPAADEPTADEPAANEEPLETEDPAAEGADADPSADGEPAAESEAELPENAAPVLDSAKEDPAAAEGGEQAGEPAEAAAPPPENDAAAQSDEITAEEVEPITAEEGRRLDEGQADAGAEDRELTREERQQARAERRAERRARQERRENAEVIEEFDDDRVVIEIGGAIYIQSPDYERIILEEDDVYYEELSNGRTREVIIRPNGVRVVTIRNRYGDVIRRSKIFPDDREVVLVYVPERYYDEVIEFRDPAEDLPPLRLTIPVSEYILEAETVEDPDRYYAFLDQPPVAEIERTYSIEEVKRSARVRDTMRRIDLDTINFEFGSAEVSESEIDELEAIAEAILRMLEENPGETFLIEGHTDAVGSDLANLALSDRRAENVARALTDVFGIPPENLVTQGYGEQYLKIETQERERENRRVAIRRITPLVAPVASAE
jgi:outer membrane protein OmpA-like peptidoglycan-associated protein